MTLTVAPEAASNSFFRISDAPAWVWGNKTFSVFPSPPPPPPLDELLPQAATVMVSAAAPVKPRNERRENPELFFSIMEISFGALRVIKNLQGHFSLFGKLVGPI